MNFQTHKKPLIDHCVSLVEEKLLRLRSELKELKIAAENDTKSSMGDKYETGREMIMQERGKLENQRALFIDQLLQLKRIDLKREYSKVEFGALVNAGNNDYLICGAIGPVTIEEKKVFVVSPNSPIAQAMMNLEGGNEFTFNGRSFRIDSIV